MTVPELIKKLQALVDEGLPEGHIVDCGGDNLFVYGPRTENDGRDELHEIEIPLD